MGISVTKIITVITARRLNRSPPLATKIAGAGQRERPKNRSEQHQTNQSMETCHADYGLPEITPPEHGWSTKHNTKTDSNGQTLDNYPSITEGELKRKSNLI